ncbi:MAG: hypothetical protein QGF46_04170 [Planctomycetota bacterium]|jgi:hypothetical protein|nr:hypothetical protein [Planctomycetota bacterium]
MPTISELTRKKHDLLQRYRAEVMEIKLAELRAEAEARSEDEEFPWSGEFRSREEIAYLYGERKRWDRRFLLDTYLLAVVLLASTIALTFAFKIVSPRPNFDKGVTPSEQQALIDSQTNR